MYAYNATPHSSTGYSPYYLFFGREPKLPVDHLLGLDNDDDGDGETTDDWVATHYRRLEEAFQRASERTEKEALRRITRNDQKADDTSLSVGTRVFLRNRGFKGRHKIQDVWNSVPHVVTKRPDPNGNVYTVTPLDGNGHIKTLQRRDLLDARRLVPDQLCETRPEEKRGVEDDQHVEDNDDDILYRVITLTPQLHKEPVLHIDAAPPTAETAGEQDQMIPAAPDDLDELRPESSNEGQGKSRGVHNMLEQDATPIRIVNFDQLPCSKN